MKANVARGLRLAVVAVIFVHMWWANDAVAAPCCIIVTQPPPPPPSPEEKPALPPPHGQLYAQLPLFAAMQRGAFGNLKVDIVYLRVDDALAKVNSTQGYLAIGPINRLGVYAAKTGAKLQIAAVLSKYSEYAIYTRVDGPTTLKALKGKTLSIPSRGSLAHLFAIQSLHSVGLSEKDVTLVPRATRDGVAALSAGKLDAATLLIGTENFDKNLMQLAWPRPISLTGWVLYTNMLTLDKETAEVKLFLKGLAEGLETVRMDRELTRRILAEQFRIVDRAMQDLIVGKYIPLLLPDTIRPDPNEIERLVNLLRVSKEVEKAAVLLDANRIKQLF